MKTEYVDIVIKSDAYGSFILFANGGMRGIFYDFETVLLAVNLDAGHNARFTTQILRFQDL
jgi:hypothetical protein